MSWAAAIPLLILPISALLIGLERLFPYDRSSRLFREGLFTDLVLYGIVEGAILTAIITALLQAIDAATGFSQRGLISGLPLWAQVVFFVVSHDLYIYWFHRLQHAWEPLWRLHEAHHSSTKVDWIAGARSHSLEILINQSVEFGAILFLGADPMVAPIKALISAAWGNWIHSNIDVKTGILQYVINGPEMHRWHHAEEMPPPGRNFATKLAIWDWIFGTAYRPNRKPRAYGLGVPFPKDIVRQHLAAFRPFGAPAVKGARATPEVPPRLEAA